jgi:hypothetical protein
MPIVEAVKLDEVLDDLGRPRPERRQGQRRG